jgi:hypothetical protein
VDVDVPTIKLINIVETALDVCHYTIGEDLLIIGGYDQSISHSHIIEVTTFNTEVKQRLRLRIRTDVSQPVN